MINTEEMVYDINKHKYILTKTYFENRINISLSDRLSHDGSISVDRDAQIFLERISDLLYDYIYNYAYDGDDMEYYLSLSTTPREIKNAETIRDSLVELGYSILLNNKEIGVFYSPDKPIDELVPPSTKQKLQANGILTRSQLVGLPNNYIDLRGKEY